MMSSYVPAAVVTKTVVAAMSNAICTTLSHVYKSLQCNTENTERGTNVEEDLEALFVRTDMELLGALLSDMEDSHENKKAVRVCLEHLHDTLKDIHLYLSQLDTHLRKSAAWFASKKLKQEEEVRDIVRSITSSKKKMDHHFLRLVQISAVVPES